MNHMGGLSTTRIAIVAIIIVVVVAAVFFVRSPRMSQSGISSIMGSTAGLAGSATSVSSVNAGLCSIPPCAPPISGWLHTKPGDTQIYDSSGNAVRLVGVNVMGLEFGTGTSAVDACKFGWGGEDAGGYSTAEFDNIAPWGFNSVRLPISWENLEPTAPTLMLNGSWTHHWNSQYLDEIDYFINQFGQRHVGVILDFAQVDLSPAFQQAPGGEHGTFCEGWGAPTWLYPGITSPTTGQQVGTAICNFFNDQTMVGNSVPAPIEGMEAAEQMLASRYVNKPAVIGVDMFNEPWFPRSCGSTSTEDGLLTNFNAKVSKAISAANPNVLVVFEDVSPNLMPQGISPILTAPPPVPNAVYSLHVYTSGWGTAEPLLQAHLNNARKWGVPLYIGEFNAFNAGDNGVYAKVDPNWQADTQSMLAFCKTNGISWSFFSYTSLGTNVPTPIPKTQILAAVRSGI